MEYLRVFMEYESDDMPVLYFYEVDVEEERLACRAIEIFVNRQAMCMEDLYHDVTEMVPIPTAKELNKGLWGSGFSASVISKEEFERVWNSPVYQGTLTAE